jgi:cyclic beta-1,2-glucan synthetase
VFVPTDDAVKITEVSLANRSDRPRRLTVTYYVEWVLGTTRAATQPFIVPAFDPESETLTAHNPWNDEFASAVAFAAAGQRLHGFTVDRGEFLGRHGTAPGPGCAQPDRPREQCAPAPIRAPRSRSTRIARRRDAHGALPARPARRGGCAGAGAPPSPARDGAGGLGGNAARWGVLACAPCVRRIPPSISLINRWLPYQTLSARVGTNRLLSSSGAFGYRDQSRTSRR